MQSVIFARNITYLYDDSDVIGIYDVEGNKLVSYTYDAWYI